MNRERRAPVVGWTEKTLPALAEAAGRHAIRDERRADDNRERRRRDRPANARSPKRKNEILVCKRLIAEPNECENCEENKRTCEFPDNFPKNINGRVILCIKIIRMLIEIHK